MAITGSLIEYLLAKLLSFQGFIVLFGVGSLSKSIKAPDISKADLKLILKNTENETIKQLATEKLQYLNSHPRLGWAASIARGQSLNDLKYRYKNATPDEKVKIMDILHNAN
ncbi:hypothetical protein [Lactobacillus delbrueckii]|uniref:hypothetical protein n=1 Tax=Lactobacillus delbrueckii TaxID=1584 RepID=UPI0039C85E2B